MSLTGLDNLFVYVLIITFSIRKSIWKNLEFQMVPNEFFHGGKAFRR